MLPNPSHVLLVHPLGYSREAASSDISRLANVMPPLGLAGIAAYLERERIRASIIDCYAVPEAEDRIAEYLRRESPGFVGFSCTTATFLDGVRLAEMTRNTLPEAKIVFGGVHVSAIKRRALEGFAVIDYAVVGEGERVLTELVQSEGGGAEGIHGLIYRDQSGEVRFSGYPEKLLELDDLPFPAYEKLEGYPRRYTLPMFNYPATPNSTCVSSRGCPYQCSYCDRSVFRRTFRHNSARYMYEHLSYLRTRFGVRHVNFYDDQFTFNRERIMDLTDMLLREPLGMTFNCAARAEHVDLDMLKQMKAAGCWMISLGIETGDPELLAKHRQNADLDMLAEKVRLIKRAGIRVKALLMMGLPGESEGSVKKSMDYVFSLPIDDLNLAKFTPFPGSPLYEKAHELGEFNEDWSAMDCMNFLFVPKGLTKERLDELFTAFYKAHFSRLKVLLGYVAMLWKSPDSWRRFVLHLFAFLRFARSDRRFGDASRGG